MNKHNVHMVGVGPTCNARRETLNGRMHLVVPVVMMVPGVHNGSGGAILYTEGELAKFPGAWDGRPVPIFHPEGPNGEPIPCNTPMALEAQSVGQLFNTQWSDGKLRSEVWVDMGKCREVSPSTLAALERGDRLEVSTGLYSDDVDTYGVWEGEEYSYVATNIRPEHLALLPGQHGACSWEDGCGIRANKGGNEVKLKGAVEDKPVKLKNRYGMNAASFQTMTHEIQVHLDALDIPDQSSHFVRDVFDDHFVYERATLSGPNAGSKLYKQGYTFDEGNAKLILHGDPTQVRLDKRYLEVTTNAKNPKNQEEGDMKVSKEKSGVVEGLIANDSTNFTEEHREWLTSLDDCQLAALAPIKANKEEEPKDAGEPKGADESPTKADVHTHSATKEESKDAGEPKGTVTVSMEQLDQMIHAGIKANDQAKAKEGMIHALIKSDCGMDEAELSAMPLAVLGKLHAMLNSTSFEGRGGPRTPLDNKGEDTVPAMPPVVTAPQGDSKDVN